MSSIDSAKLGKMLPEDGHRYQSQKRYFKSKKQNRSNVQKSVIVIKSELLSHRS
jgi:hypothetical protein